MVNAIKIGRVLSAALATLLALGSITFGQSQTQPLSPSDTVRSFYKLMREKKFREAFALSIYRPAIDPLTPVEFSDLQLDF